MGGGDHVGQPVAARSIPAPPGGHLSRPRLLALMDGALDTPLTVVAAPAGAGKTALVAEWAGGLAGRPLSALWTDAESPGWAVGWVSCEEWLQDPREFWWYLQHAVQTALQTGVQTGVQTGPQTGSARRVPDRPSAPALPRQRTTAAKHVRPLLTTLAQAERPVVLVLDDFHLVTNQPTLAELDDLLPRLPPSVHLVVVSRSDPPLSVERLRVAGAQLQVRAADLAFTSGEVERLVADAGVGLEADDVGLLLSRTEGWAAGIRLALLAMRDRDNAAEVLEQLVQDDSPVAAYLVEQVLGRLEPQLREFVLATSIVERFTPELAAAVTGRDDADAVLRELVASHTFLLRLDTAEPTYRYHALFGALLQHRLAVEHDPDRVRDLHRSAARRLHVEGKEADAVRHALTAADWSVAAGMLSRLAVRAVPRGQHRVVGDLLRRFPQQQRASDPRLRVIAAVTSLLEGDDDAAAALLATGPIDRQDDGRADEHVDGAETRRLAAMWAIATAGVERVRGQHADALCTLSTPFPDLPTPDEPEFDPADASLTSEWLCARAAALLWSGRVGDAADAAGLALPHAERGGNEWNLLDAWGVLALVDVVRGRLSSADRTVGSALAFARARMWLDLPQMVPLHMADCYIRLSRGDLPGAQRAFERCEQAWHWLPHRPTSRILSLLRAWIDLCHSGDGRQALRATELVVTASRAEERSWLERRLTVVVRAHSQLSLGHVDEAVAAAGAASPDDFGPGHDVLMAWLGARQLLFHSGEHRRDAEPQLQQVHDAARRLEVVPPDLLTDNCVRLRLLLTCALLALRRGETARSSHLLELVLDDIARDGWRLPLSELGEGARELLRSQYGQVTRHGLLLAGLLAEQRVDGHASQLIAPLSERESEVLVYLPTGLSQAELCEALFISNNTLKSHLRSIYRKLGVESRREAVIHARSIDLL